MKPAGAGRFGAAWIAWPLGLYGLGCATTGMLAYADIEIWLLALYISGGVAAFAGWRSLRGVDVWRRYLSFGSVLLLVCVANRVFYASDYLMYGPRFDEWPVFSSAPEWALAKGEIITVVGTLLTVLVWILGGGHEVSIGALFTRPKQNRRLMWILYLVSIATLLLSLVNPVVVSALGQLVPVLLTLGLVAGALLSVLLTHTLSMQLAATTVLTLPFLIFSLGLGMKEGIILSLIPIAISAWRAVRHPILRTGLVVFAFVTVGLLTAYVGFYRDEVWLTNSDKPTQEVLSDFVTDIESKGLFPVVADGVVQFVARSNATVHRGWTVAVADEQGFYSELVFAPMAYVFVPRVLWPEKPAIEQGKQYSGLLYGASYMDQSGSSSAAGLYTSFYLGGGWTAVFLGSIALGFLIAITSRLAQRAGGSVCAGLYLVALLPYMLRLDETWSVGALSGPVISLVYVIAIVQVTRWVDGFFLGAAGRLR